MGVLVRTTKFTRTTKAKCPLFFQENKKNKKKQKKQCARQNYKVHTDEKGQMTSFSSFPNLCTMKFEFDVDYFFNFSNINNVLVRITKFTRTTKAKCPLFLPFQTCIL